MLTKQTRRFFAKDESIKVAAEMQANDEDWIYIPKHDPNGTGWSFIEIFDENGEFVGEVR